MVLLEVRVMVRLPLLYLLLLRAILKVLQTRVLPGMVLLRLRLRVVEGVLLGMLVLVQ